MERRRQGKTYKDLAPGLKRPDKAGHGGYASQPATERERERGREREREEREIESEGEVERGERERERWESDREEGERK